MTGDEAQAAHPANGRSAAFGYCWACHRSFSVLEMADHQDCQMQRCGCGDELRWDGFLVCPTCDAPSVGPDMPRLKGRKDRWWL